MLYPDLGSLSSVIFEQILFHNRHISSNIPKLREERRRSNQLIRFKAPENRHKQIFPQGFDQIATADSHLPYSFAPEQLCQLLTSNYNPNEHVESIVVKSAQFGKESKAAKHEFILFELEDLQVPGLINYVVLDRNNSDHRAYAASRLISNPTSSSHTAAKDEFRISYDGNKDQLLALCNLDQGSIVEKMDFATREPLPFYQVVALAKSASAQRQRYRPVKANCYWFAGLVWDCMRFMRPDANHQDVQGRLRGRFHAWLRHTTNPAELALTYRSVQEELKSIELELAAHRERAYGNGIERLAQENQAQRQRIEELQKQLEEVQLRGQLLLTEPHKDN